jgi:hypothetical protein
MDRNGVGEHPGGTVAGSAPGGVHRTGRGTGVVARSALGSCPVVRDSKPPVRVVPAAPRTVSHRNGIPASGAESHPLCPFAGILRWVLAEHGGVRSARRGSRRVAARPRGLAAGRRAAGEMLRTPGPPGAGHGPLGRTGPGAGGGPRAGDGDRPCRARYGARPAVFRGGRGAGRRGQGLRGPAGGGWAGRVVARRRALGGWPLRSPGTRGVCRSRAGNGTGCARWG